MGRWKRVYSSNRSSESGSNYLWSTKSYALKDLSSKFKLPLISRCDIIEGLVTSSDFNFDLKQPLLLHSIHHTRKLLVRSVKPKGGDWEDVGPPLIIPERYDGWFQIISTGEIPNLRLKTLDEVAQCPHQQFLTTEGCSGVQVVPGGDGSTLVHGVKVGLGDVIDRVDVIDAPDVDSDLINPGSKYMRFRDEHDEEFLVQYDQRVSLYPVNIHTEPEVEYDADENPYELMLDTTVLYSPRALISGRLNQTLFLRQIYGEPPNIPCTNTGILRAIGSTITDTILVSTLDDTNPLPLELAVNSYVRFSIALNLRELRQTDVCQSAISACESHGDQYLCKMKVAFTLSPEVAYGKDMDSSFYSESEMGEVDANSEFDIEWKPGDGENRRKMPTNKTNVMAKVNALEPKQQRKQTANNTGEHDAVIGADNSSPSHESGTHAVQYGKEDNSNQLPSTSVSAGAYETQAISLNVSSSSLSDEAQACRPEQAVIMLLDDSTDDKHNNNNDDDEDDEGCFV